MAGALLRLMPRTVMKFDVVANQTSQIILADKIDATGWASGVLAVRYHAVTSFGSPTANLRIGIYPMSFAPEEPQTDFWDPNTPLGFADFSSNDTPPLLKTYGFTFPTALVRLVATVTQGATTGTIDGAWGVEVVGRSSS